MNDIDQTFERLRRSTFKELLKEVFSHDRLTLSEFYTILKKNNWSYEEYKEAYTRNIV